jgi:hypothetical protein
VVENFSIRRFIAVTGSVAVALSFFALAALKLAGAGGFAAAGWVAIMLACLLAGLGFSSWLFEDCEIRR